MRYARKYRIIRKGKVFKVQGECRSWFLFIPLPYWKWVTMVTHHATLDIELDCKFDTIEEAEAEIKRYRLCQKHNIEWEVIKEI